MVRTTVDGTRRVPSPPSAPAARRRDVLLGRVATFGVRAAAALGVRSAERIVPQRFVSRPDLLPPPVHVEIVNGDTAPGYIFLDPCRNWLDPRGVGVQVGPMIVDSAGRLVGFWPSGDATGTITADLKMQQFRGEPVLTWWRGRLDLGGLAGYGRGEYLITDRAYRRIGVIRAGNGLDGDLHDMVITARDTALLTIYRTVRREQQLLVESVVQEVEIDSGAVLFEWHSLDHIAPEETTATPDGLPGMGFDYLHINSVAEAPNGDLLLCARHTDALYLIDRETGAVRWRLGGSSSDFTIDEDARLGRQHDARWLPDGRISVFDNVSDTPGPPSRAVVLDVDEQAMTVRLVRTFPHPGGMTSASQGGHQVLPGGNSFVGWGSQPQFTEFDSAGNVCLHASFGAGMTSYRACRAEWRAIPDEPPALALRSRGAPRAYLSWNGCTEHRSWRILGGSTEDQLEPVIEAPRTGFETVVQLPAQYSYVVAEALDAHGEVLGRSKPSRGRENRR